MTQEQKELLRIEYYKVMEYSQPFGNEHHEELFEWFISKIKEAEWQKDDVHGTEKIFNFLTDLHHKNTALTKLISIIDNMISNGGDPDLYAVKNHAESLLQKERQDIIDAHFSGQNQTGLASENYFNNRFK